MQIDTLSVVAGQLFGLQVVFWLVRLRVVDDRDLLGYGYGSFAVARG